MKTLRVSPNILITGTPGVGKSTLAKLLADKLKLEWIDVSKFAIDNQLLEEYDEELSTHIIDEDAVLDALETIVKCGGKILEYTSSEFFPERWFDLIFVVRCDNTILYDRLKARGYSDLKLQNNIESEIFGVLSEEAHNSYQSHIITELNNEKEEDMATNLEIMIQKYNLFLCDGD